MITLLDSWKTSVIESITSLTSWRYDSRGRMKAYTVTYLCYVLGTILSIFQILSHLFPITTYKIGTHLPYFRDEETEAEARRV